MSGGNDGRAHSAMAETATVRKTLKYKLRPTLKQAHGLDRALMLCRHVYNAAMGERREAWRMCGVAITYYQQKAELPDIKAAMPENAEVHSQVLQDVVLRVDRAFQAFFQRIKEGKTPGYPRFHGRDPYTNLTYPQYGNGATLDKGCLILSNIRRLAVLRSHPLERPPNAAAITRDTHSLPASF